MVENISCSISTKVWEQARQDPTRDPWVCNHPTCAMGPGEDRLSLGFLYMQ